MGILTIVAEPEKLTMAQQFPPPSEVNEDCYWFGQC